MGETYRNNGFIYIDNVLPQQQCHLLLAEIKNKLANFIKNHNVKTHEYFRVVNRWPLNALIGPHYIEELKDKLKPILKEDLDIFEADVLYKSLYAPLSTPCHQDISYAWHKPYLCSTWIALTEVGIEESPMQFLTKSHLGPILPAVDFWSPDFTDTIRHSEEWQSTAITCPVKTGDGLLFSSRLWHGSKEHTSKNERFSIVIRWGNSRSASEIIPKPLISHFGLWNCGEITHKLLEKSFDEWIKDLEESNIEATKALKEVRLLDNAYRSYGGGDSQGIIYKRLWNVLLSRL